MSRRSTFCNSMTHVNGPIELATSNARTETLVCKRPNTGGDVNLHLSRENVSDVISRLSEHYYVPASTRESPSVGILWITTPAISHHDYILCSIIDCLRSSHVYQKKGFHYGKLLSNLEEIYSWETGGAVECHPRHWKLGGKVVPLSHVCLSYGFR